MSEARKRTVLLVDGYSLIFRAFTPFRSLPPRMEPIPTPYTAFSVC